MTDSSIVRRKRAMANWFRKILAWFIPMATTRKPHTEGNQGSFDKSVMTWRAFMTALLLMLFPGVQSRLGLSDVSTDNHTLLNTVDRIERRITALEGKVELLSTKVDYVSAFVDGMKKMPHPL